VYRVRWLLALPVLFPLGALQAQQPQEAQQWKWDKPYKQTLTTKIEQTLTVAGKPPVKQTQEVTVIVRFTPKLDAMKKTVAIQAKLEALSVKVMVGEDTMSFDSTKTPDPKKLPLHALLQPLVGTEITVTLDPMTMKVQQIENKNPLANVPDGPGKAYLEHALNQDSLKQLFEQTFPQLPAKKGDKQEHTGTFTLPTGKYVTKTTYENSGEKDGNIAFKKSTTTTWTVPASEVRQGVKIKPGDVNPAQGQGTILFDSEKGRVARSELKVNNWTRKMILTVDGKDVDASTVVNQTTTIVTAD
jgi:hypothetical protein